MIPHSERRFTAKDAKSAKEQLLELNPFSTFSTFAVNGTIRPDV